MTPDRVSPEMEAALDRPFTFDLLRDPEWQPTRENYRSLRDAAVAALDSERARAEAVAKWVDEMEAEAESSLRDYGVPTTLAPFQVAKELREALRAGSGQPKGQT